MKKRDVRCRQGITTYYTVTFWGVLEYINCLFSFRGGRRRDVVTRGKRGSSEGKGSRGKGVFALDRVISLLETEGVPYGTAVDTLLLLSSLRWGVCHTARAVVGIFFARSSWT